MTLHARTRHLDRKRATQLMTAHACNDYDALVEVLTEAIEEPEHLGASGLILALLDYIDWLNRNTGPLLTDGQDTA